MGGLTLGLPNLQGVYDASAGSVPLIALTPGVGGITIRDNAAPLGTSLLEVANNLGVPFVRLSATGIDGGTVNTANLNLAANSIGTGDGRINANSPIVFGPYSATTAAYGFSYTAVESFAGAFVGGGLNFSGTIGFSNSTFIYESFRGAPTITTGVNPGFAAYTVLQALPALVAGAAAGHRPLAPLILNAGPQIHNPFAGTRTTPTAGAVNWSPTVRSSLLGAVMNVTSITGLINAPKYSTVAGSSISFGTIRGLHAQVPAVGLFQPGAGTETMVAYYAVDVDNLGAFGGTAPAIALRSAIAAGTNQFFLQNNGGATSQFLNSFATWNDNFGVTLGTGLDVLLNWNGSALEFDPAVGPDLRLAPNVLDYWEVTGSAARQGLGLNVETIVLGTPAADPATANYFVRFAGPALRQPQAAGVYSDIQWSANGQIDVNGLAMTEINSVRIDANVTLLSGGSVQDQSGIFVAGMGFPGSGAATRIQSLRITGRSRLDGLLNFTSISPAQIVANQNNYALAANNTRRYQMRMSTDASRTITGIAVPQTGDTLVLVNVGAFNLVLSHQDVLSLASNRIISPSGVNYTIGPDETATLWHDDVTDRWRIEHGTGA